jgi:polar amino acid transport system substrate-binding protein
MGHIVFSGILFAAAMLAVGAAADSGAALRELAATGKLRVGVVFAPTASAYFVIKDADGTPRGVTVDIGDELAGSLGVPVEFLVAPNSGEVTDALERGSIDVAFMPVDDERRKRVDFGPSYFMVESTCLVLGSSDFKTNRDLDRTGVRVAGVSNTTTIRSAARVLPSATIVPVPSVGGAIELLRDGRVDALALSRDSLLPYQAEIPGSRILEGGLQTTGVAIAVPKNHPAALAYVSAFLERAKASGLIRRAFDRAGLQSQQVAPAEPVKDH